ncbi:hypothetical protein [Moraxella marmotae]|uniref:hypothetical protein n=1 Tax=Moraxella marmotae TaxID=3344520 RepID=UPI0035F26AB5
MGKWLNAKSVGLVDSGQVAFLAVSAYHGEQGVLADWINLSSISRINQPSQQVDNRLIN